MSGLHVPLRFLRTALKKGLRTLKEALPPRPTVPLRNLVPAYAHLPRPRPTLKQRLQNRQYTTTTTSPLRYNSRSTPKRYVAPSPLRHTLATKSVFTTSLRPGLHGTLGRSTMGSARGFASAAAPADVIANVALGMRAFCLAAEKQRRRGLVQQQARSVVANAPGSYVDFDIRPRIASGVLGREYLREMKQELESAARTLTAVVGELEKLAGLGELEVGVCEGVVRVRFPGMDRTAVETLCDEVGVGRGVVHEDEVWEVPRVSWEGMLQSQITYDDEALEDSEVEACFAEYESDGVVLPTPGAGSPELTDEEDGLTEYSYGYPGAGVQEIHRFIQACDSEYRNALVR